MAKQSKVHVQLRVEHLVTKFLEICVTLDMYTGILRIANRSLIDSTVKRFGLTDAKSVPTPVATGVRIDLDTEFEQF